MGLKGLFFYLRYVKIFGDSKTIPVSQITHE